MQMTVLQLFNELKKAMVNDPSCMDKKIVVADDNEGNGYHGMFYGLTTDKKSITEIVNYSNVYDTQEVNPDKIVILG